MAAHIVEEMVEISSRARVFLSMPYVRGLTPRILNEKGRYEVYDSAEQVQRRHAILRMDEAALSPLDHGGLYGDACFEGVLITNGRIFLFKEHLERWWASAAKLSITMPYRMEDLAWQILRTVQEAGFSRSEKGYLRPVLTRGAGNLGINPAKCVAPTIYVIASTIQLYPPEKYKVGIELSIARKTRRAGKTIIDPNIKSNNYLNNIGGLLESVGEGTMETLMLTETGTIAEATADNIFCVSKSEGWESDPSKVSILTPMGDYCLIGITRNLVMSLAAEFGYRVTESSSMLPIDLIGPDRECFMTGTGCGLMPVVGIQGRRVGDGTPGPVTRRLLESITGAMADPTKGLGIEAARGALADYLGRS